MLDLIKNLIEELNKNNIKYCQWKSNINLDKALSGFDDLDLLVAWKDISRFESTVLALNFKSAFNKNILFPSVEHYFGCDLTTGKIVHLHVYYKIITGPSLTKSYAFNIEDAILNNLEANNLSEMPIPLRYVEFVIYTIRTMTKLSFLCEHLLLRNSFVKIHQEMSYLYSELDDEKIESFLQIYFPTLKLELLKECMSAIIDRKHIRLFHLGKKIRCAIDKHRRISRSKELEHLLFQIIYRILNRLFFHRKKRFNTGGVLIAIVGADATGKTTITNELYKWLSKNFTTHLIHTGKPPSAILTFPMNLAIKIIKLVKSKSGQCCVSENKKVSALMAVRLMVLAYDRSKLIRRFWRKAVNGDIVICDRYPSTDIGVMDSRRMQPKELKGFKKILAEYEQRCYESIPMADVILQLYVPVEIAVERNNIRDKAGKENEEFIRLRHKNNHGLTYKTKVLYSIDTSGNYDKIIIQLKKLLWQNL